MRIAAYRHNRHMRRVLPDHLARWSAGCTLSLAVMSVLDAVGRDSMGHHNLFFWLAVACATLFAIGLCVVSVTAYVYLYLSRNDR